MIIQFWVAKLQKYLIRKYIVKQFAQIFFGITPLPLVKKQRDVEDSVIMNTQD